jgi:hypothetical protein
MTSYYNLLQAVATQIEKETGLKSFIEPAAGATDEYHLRLTLLTQVEYVGNGRIRLQVEARLRGTATASERAISNSIAAQLAMADYFDTAQNVTFDESSRFYGMIYSTPRSSDEAAIIEIAPNGYEYNSYWLLQVEFDRATAINFYGEKENIE